MFGGLRGSAVLLVVGLAAQPLSAQEVGLIVGVGRTGWGGTAAGSWGSSTGLSFAQVSGRWSMAPSLDVGLEVGGGAWAADLGPTGAFVEDTRVGFQRLRLSAVVRPTLAVWGGERPRTLYAEIGAGGWARTGCEVDLTGGPGFLGGETLACEDWSREGGGGPLDPRDRGVTLLAGLGLRWGRWGVGLRHERETADPLRTPAGPVRPHTLALTGEWVFAGAGPRDRSPGVEAESRQGHPPPGEGPRQPLLAGILELSMPTLGYGYAGRWSDGILPNVVRVGGVVLSIVGWGEDDAFLLTTGVVGAAVGTVWAVAGAVGAASRGEGRGGAGGLPHLTRSSTLGFR